MKYAPEELSDIEDDGYQELLIAAVKLSANAHPYQSFRAESIEYRNELVAVRREHLMALRAAICKSTS